MNRAHCTDANWVERSDCRHCAVRQFSIFSVLPEEAFSAIPEPIDHLTYSKQGRLYSQGEPGEYVFSIRSGWVKLVVGDADGVEHIVRLVGPGGLLGLELLLSSADGRYSRAAVAHGEVDLCRIPLSTLRELELKHPELYPAVFQRCSEQARLADEVIVSFVSGALHTRVEHALAFLARETADQHGQFSKMSDADMAAWVGASVESVSRELAALKRQGRLQCADGRCTFV
jgi:CRP-like cAMP-binding protein